MAKQQDLSDFIKKVHIDLRLSSKQFGAETAWEQHCKKHDILEKYAITMRDLATLYWDKNITNGQNVNRITWVVEECERYFSVKGQKEVLEKQQRLLFRYFEEERILEYEINECEKQKLKLLDVGSCYNPFNSFAKFDVTAIDLAPATEDVFKCDFLKLELDDFLIKENSIISLPKQYFDIVVLSLLLEYLPHSVLRYECCLKAYDLLRPGGLLLIISPDSKHPSANSQIIKNWRLALASIGFLKVSYEKSTHLHCLSYTKSFDQRIPARWLSLKHLNTEPKDLMIISQDSVEYQSANDTVNFITERCENDNKSIADIFSILAADV